MGARIKRLWDSLELATTSPGTPLITATKVYIMFTRVTVTNNDSSARTFSAYIVRSGQAASLDDAEYVIKDRSVAPGETFACQDDLEGHVLNPGDSLYMVASAANALTAHGSGIEVDA
jgi:hypothetical protein